MGQMHGADADELERFAHTVRVAADRLEAIRAEVTTSFQRSHWDGHDADHFRGQWHYRLSGMIQATVVANRDAAQILVRNAHQQRAVSGADGWTPVSPPQPYMIGPDILGSLEYMVKIGGHLMLIPNLLKEVIREYGALPIGLFDSKILYDLIRERDLPKFLGSLHVADKLGPLAVVGGLIDGATLVDSLYHNGLDSPETLRAGIDVAFDVAEGVCVFACPPLGLAIGGVHLAYDVYNALPPGTQEAIVHGVQDAAEAVVDVASDAVQAAGTFATDAADAVGGFVSGGVNSIGKFFGF